MSNKSMSKKGKISKPTSAQKGSNLNDKNKKKVGREYQGRTEREQEWLEKVIQVCRVTKVVKGGKNLSFRALVVIGDERGSLGVGLGKAAEVVDAVKKAIEQAKRKLVKISFDQGSIPHNIVGKSNSTTVHLFRAPKGTGLIAAHMIKTALELAGLHNVVCKVHGSTNPTNVLLALVDAIRKLKTKGQIRQIRGIPAPAAAASV